MKTLDVKQGTSEWLTARAGIVTCSELDNIVTPTWKARTGQTPQNYMYRKVAERIMGMPLMSGGSFSMEQGTMLENEAIPYLSFTYDLPIERIGMVTTDDGKIGCSPDGIIATDGGVEIKCPEPHTHVRYLMQNELPDEYAAQVHGAMMVTGRPWWMFCSYSRQFPPLIMKVMRDETIQERLRAIVSDFNNQLDEAVAKIRKMKADDLARKEADFAASR